MESTEKLLEKILDYSMTPEETKAWKISILFLTLANKRLPDGEKLFAPRKDPRKSLLFKYSYKALKEFEDRFKTFGEWRDFVDAQIVVLKNIKTDDSHAMISPSCLVGQKAWSRYQVYLKSLEKTVLYQDRSNVKMEDGGKFRESLIKSKKFLENKLKIVSEENVLKSFESRALLRWIALGSVSAVVLVMYESIHKRIKEEKNLEKYNVSLDSLCLPDNAKKVFHEIFSA